MQQNRQIRTIRNSLVRKVLDTLKKTRREQPEKFRAFWLEFGHVMKEGKVHRVIVGADRIAANGDTANKIGTYSLAVLAKEHHLPFYVAAPSSTFDLSIPDGSAIPIEQRAPEEVTEGFGQRTAPKNVRVYNPAFDVTPARYITAVITERGIIERPDAEKIRRHFERGKVRT